MMYKIIVSVLFACAFTTYLPAHQSVTEAVQLQAKKGTDTTIKLKLPEEPKYRFIDVPMANYVLIAENDWLSLDKYSYEFEKYATALEKELAGRNPAKTPPKRPLWPKLITTNVPVADLPAMLRSSKDKYLSLSLNDRKVLEKQLDLMRNYIKDSKQLS